MHPWESVDVRTVMIVIQTGDRRKYDVLAQRFRQLFERDCRVLENAWALRVREPGDLIKNLVKSGVVDPDDRLIVLPVVEPWEARNCERMEDCKRLWE